MVIMSVESWRIALWFSIQSPNEKDSRMVAVLIPCIVFLVPMGMGVAIIHGFRLFARHKKRRTPLTTHLLCSPGEALRARIDELTQDITFDFGLMPSILLFFYAAHITESYLFYKPETSFRIIASVVIALAFLCYPLLRLTRSLNLRRRLRLAHDAETAVGQALNQLMGDGQPSNNRRSYAT
jgi:hypothetical protein